MCTKQTLKIRTHFVVRLNSLTIFVCLILLYNACHFVNIFDNIHGHDEFFLDQQTFYLNINKLPDIFKNMYANNSMQSMNITAL